MKTRIIIVMVAVVFVITAALFYLLYLPELQNSWLLKCHFRELTGLKCPGCGSGRAFYALLNLRLWDAICFNPLFVISLPYIALGTWSQAITYIYKDKNSTTMWRIAYQIRCKLFGRTALFVVVAVFLHYMLYRNLLGF